MKELKYVAVGLVVSITLLWLSIAKAIEQRITVGAEVRGVDWSVKDPVSTPEALQSTISHGDLQ